MDNKDKCYFCGGSGLLQSDEECMCVTNSCECRVCING